MRLTERQRALIQDESGGAEILDGFSPFEPEKLEPALAGSDVMVTFRVPADLKRKAPKMKWIHLMSAGVEHALAAGVFDLPGLLLTNSSGIHGTTIGEYILGSMLAYAHRLYLPLRAQLRHEWLPNRDFMKTVFDLRGKTAGIVGYGSIGRETARLAQAFGMEVIALKRNPHDHIDPGWCAPNVGDPQGLIPKRWFGPEQRVELVAQSDFIVVTLPLTPDTRHFLGAREFAAARPTAYVVNVGRGEVIDQDAIIEALKSGRLGGAGLDVTTPEPLGAQSPLWDIENVLLTPHISGAKQGYNDEACAVFVENLRRFTAGHPMLNLVDRSQGY
ncbi:MAG TPA: D-2-hydroxyacid dehydrogenase [Candidatus Binataceae bacterium]|nr:D-2-hydroxyacid dehydrogenase [Candidatus Binataceae bacterium]